MQHLHLRVATPLIILFSPFFGQTAFAQTDPPPPVMHDQEMVEEEKGVTEPAPFVIPKHWKTGKPQAGRKNNKYYGYVLNDSILIPFEYEELDITYSDFMIAKREGMWGAINKRGEAVLPFVYISLINGRKGTLIAARKYHEYGLLSRANDVLVPLEFKQVIHVNDSVLIFNHPYKQVVVEVLNQQEIRAMETFEYEQFAPLGSLYPRFFSAKVKEGETGIVDLNNRVLLPFEYHKIHWQHGNLINFETEQSLQGLVNFQNQMRAPAVYPYLNSTTNPNLFGVRDARGKLGMIDSTGNIVVPLQYYSCWVLENLECIKCKTVQGHYALWNDQGKQLSKEIYEEIHGNKTVPDVLAAQLPDSKKWQILDRQGRILCRELVDDYYFFPLGFKCEKAGLAAIFDLSGRQVTDFVYKNASSSFDTVEAAEKRARALGLPEGTRLICQAINAAGVRVYIDDTGNGHQTTK
ncbi:MAG: WG repeat-containing protein [Lewinellaceae bacterium]|nr:WG repeat-containing protein [Lewinellaceae bacterium]